MSYEFGGQLDRYLDRMADAYDDDRFEPGDDDGPDLDYDGDDYDEGYEADGDWIEDEE